MTTARSGDDPTDSALLRHTDRGDPAAPTILLIHGGAGPDSLTELEDALLPARRVIRVTLPGWDDNPRSSATATVADLAAQVVALLAALDIHGSTVVGSSFGGWVASLTAELDPGSHIAHLILMDPIGLHPQREAFTTSGRGPSSAVLQTLRAYGGDDLADPDLAARLARLTMPVLLIWGQADPIAPVAQASDWARAASDAPIVIIADAGHIPSRTHANKIRDAILNT